MEFNQHEARAAQSIAWAIAFVLSTLIIAATAAQWAPYNRPPPCECDADLDDTTDPKEP